MSLKGTVGAPASAPVGVDWLKLIADVAKLRADLKARDWVAVVSDLQAIAADLGGSIGADEMGALAEALTTHVETAPLATNPPPANNGNS